MPWGRRRESEPAPADPQAGKAERLTTVGRHDVRSETVDLSDRDTVACWLDELSPVTGVQVWVHRTDGTYCASVDDDGATVLWGDGVHADAADPEPGSDQKNIRTDQMRDIMLGALTTDMHTAWPYWDRLT